MSQRSTIDFPSRSAKNDLKLLQLQQHFNNPGLQFSFGYGSGVFPQAGYLKGTSKPQLDVIHIVENPLVFHRANAARHPKHYSSLIKLGDSVIQWIQDCGAGVYFNPYVTMKDSDGEEVVLKYGVVSSQNALRDLRDWTSLYISGRLQKPVKHLYGINDDLKIANEYNLESAFNLSLLIISSSSSSNLITATQLFEQIASISYMGDPRMIIGGENPNKVKNIVKKQLPYFEQLYSRAIEKAIIKNFLKKQGTMYDVTLNSSLAAQILVHLPKTFKKRFLNSFKNKHSKLLSQDRSMLKFLEYKESHDDADSPCMSIHADHPYIHEVLRDPTSKRVLLSTISSIIAFPALAQSLKGILTAGVVKSTRYAWEKKLKSLGP
ncbi:hypothetical protein JCM33374_g181 [Metschnikowia sp. JCM 33374]|nr:hypothetical protein JCM33374_g181 [Metschnikowia sp. JCM 33374]